MINVDNMRPFWGVVENNKDPEQLGRVQVRCFGYHPRNRGEIPTEGLPWMLCVTSNSSGVSGIGENPYYAQGSTVFGYFVDRTLQIGFVLGSITGAPEELVDSKLGFNDPDGILPNYKQNESDVNRLARGSSNHWLIKKKQDSKIDEEPSYENNATYPHNHVKEFENQSHIKEYDNTPGNERIHEWHKAGTYYEVKSDGTRVLKVVGDDYEIVIGDRNVNVSGNVSVKVDGNCDIDVEGTTKIKAPTIQLGENDKVEPSILGDKLSSWINDELVPWLNSHNHIGDSGGPTSPAEEGSNGPFSAGTASPGAEIYSKNNTNQ